MMQRPQSGLQSRRGGCCAASVLTIFHQYSLIGMKQIDSTIIWRRFDKNTQAILAFIPSLPPTKMQRHHFVRNGNECSTHPQHLLQLLHLRMIPRIPHPPTPPQLPTLKHPLAPILTILPALQPLTSTHHNVLQTTDNIARHTTSNISRLRLRHLQIADHTERFVQLARTVAVEGVGFVESRHCALFVVWHADELAAADDCEGCRWGCGSEGGGWEGAGEGADVFFAVLWTC